MTSRRILLASGVLIALGVAAFAVTRGIERLMTPAQSPAMEKPAAPAAAQVAHIRATLFFGAAAGDEYLMPAHREVPLADSVNEQGRQIVTAELQPPSPPLISLIPAGTTLRNFYVTDRGDAFVDLSADVSLKHPGGSSTELLTVYAIVNAVTANLPTVQRVQILIDGREADTLAGHVDLRRPLQQDLSLSREETDSR